MWQKQTQEAGCERTAYRFPGKVGSMEGVGKEKIRKGRRKPLVHS